MVRNERLQTPATGQLAAQESWPKRHPVIVGALAGCGGRGGDNGHHVFTELQLRCNARGVCCIGCRSVCASGCAGGMAHLEGAVISANDPKNCRNGG
jgi:hypothetical protein